jgi:hypothetical protein
MGSRQPYTFLCLVVVAFACSKSGLGANKPGADAQVEGAVEVSPPLDLSRSEDVAPSADHGPDMSWSDSWPDNPLVVKDSYADEGGSTRGDDAPSVGDGAPADGDSVVHRLDAAPVDTRPGNGAPGEVSCGAGVTCNDSTGPCCPAATSMSRTALCTKNCASPAVFCDGPEDCTNGKICCSIESATTGFVSASCATASECVALSRRICHVDVDCLPGQRCDVPNPPPSTQYSPSEIDVWVVRFLVCAS